MTEETKKAEKKEAEPKKHEKKGEGMAAELSADLKSILKKIAELSPADKRCSGWRSSRTLRCLSFASG